MSPRRKAELRTKKAAKRADLKPGDTVLLGAAGVSAPGDWFVATVLLVCGDEIATEHHPASNWGAQRQFLPISHVRAIGDYGALHQFKMRCIAEMREHQRQIDDAGAALVRARDEMWAALAAIGAGAIERLPPTEQAA